MIAPREEVNGLVAGREAGHRHITVGYRRGEAGFCALNGERQRLSPDAELIERQQGFRFIRIVAVAIDQLAGQRAVLEPKAILGIAVADQHAKPAIAVVEAPVMPWSRVRCIMRQSSKKCRRGQMKLAQMLAL